jgi:L,D-transpeptidase catalytic domain/Putative peptidoglycan binding domain/PKD domain
VRRAAIIVLALAFAPAAHAAPPAVSVQASRSRGPAPLAVTLTASGDAATYHWDLGDGSSADGAVVQHVYAAGSFTARVTATGPGGETAQAEVTIVSLGLTLSAPRVGRYQQLLRFHGRLHPAQKGVPIALYRDGVRLNGVKTTRGGRFSLRGRVGTPGAQYTVRYGDVLSNAVGLAVRPGLDTAFLGSGRIGRPLALTARERPSSAGTLTVRVWRAGRLVTARTGHGRLRVRLSTNRSVTYRVLVTVTGAQGYVSNRRLLRQTVFVPNLRIGDTGPSVYGLEQRLHELHYPLARVDGYYGVDTSDAVVAFQKLHGLARTGTVDTRVWRALEAAHIPRPRLGGNHIEVSKERQVLLLVRDGRVAMVIPVSTGATGNTPVGVWHVYMKVPGFNALQMYYSSFFVGAFAIHGYPSVPAYPASHGCVRIPLWVAPRLYSLVDYGTTVYIY